MENRYRTNLKKVFLTDQELATFLTIDTSNYEELVFELRRIGNNINQIARTVNQTKGLSQADSENLKQGMKQLISEVVKDFSIKCQQLRDYYGCH